MAKERRWVVDYAVYHVVRLLVTVLRALPFKMALRVADGLAWLANKLDARHSRVARENLIRAFPGRYSEKQLDALVAAVYRHFCRMLIEIVHIDRIINTLNWRDHLEYASEREARLCVGAMLGGRSVLMVTGHFGNWEVSSYLQGMLGFRGYAIARPIDNPYIDVWLRKWRQATGQRVLAKKGDFDRIEEVLKKGGILATLGDQDAGARGLFVSFFNRPASTHKAVALLAIEHKTLMIVTGTARIGDNLNYRVYVEDVIDPLEYDDRKDAVSAITERFTAALERIIRRHPEQYFWLHRRWKHQPPLARKKAS